MPPPIKRMWGFDSPSRHMKQTTVMRAYAAGFMSACGLIATMSFTQPVPSEKPVEVQRTLYSQVPTAKPGRPPKAVAVEEGEALAYVRIPRFGKDWIWTVVEGTAMEDLARGPGHFAHSALPGARGNTAYAGHRSGYGDPFLNFDRLQVGDEIILAQNGAEWTYEVTMTPRVIEPDELWVVKPMEAGHWLTLTTCYPKFGSSKRMYVRAVLHQ